MKRKVRISKLISLLLRHKPELGDLHLDEKGFVPVKDLVRAVKTIMGGYVTENEIIEIISKDTERFELKDDLVRARYGHSFPIKIGEPLQPEEVPEVLYHGTTREALSSILKEGLKPMRRRYVHLSLTVDRALQVARRKKGPHVVLRIRARELAKRGYDIYRPSELTFLVGEVPPDYIEGYDTV